MVSLDGSCCALCAMLVPNNQVTEPTMTRAIDALLDSWLANCPDPARAPLEGMDACGLLAPAESYGKIARVKAALVERTGLLGVGGIWAGRQLVGRHFIAGFGTATQRDAWLDRAISVAISEPGVGAHPKRLTTHADADADGFRITGEKAWVSNAPSAEAFVVLAITATEGDRKRYSALLVPRDSPGLTLKDMPRFHALRPSRHAGLVLDGVRVPRDAVLGPEGAGYETMALPFRDVEDAVSTFGLLGALRFLRRALTGSVSSGEEAALSLGGLTALNAVFADAAEALVSGLDAGRLADKAATLVGLRVLAAELMQRVRVHTEKFGPRNDPAIDEVLRDLDVSLSVARGPRQVRQARLGAP